jgi:hypothetical protein
MNKLLLLFLTIILGLTYVILPDWDGSFMTPDPFPFFDFKIGGIAYQTYIYMICEYLVSLIFVGIIANEATEYRRAIQIFFLLVVVDLVDFLCNYNAVWFHLGSFPVSMNILKCGIFGLVILNVWIRTLLSK